MNFFFWHREAIVPHEPTPECPYDELAKRLTVFSAFDHLTLPARMLLAAGYAMAVERHPEGYDRIASWFAEAHEIAMELACGGLHES